FNGSDSKNGSSSLGFTLLCHAPQRKLVIQNGFLGAKCWLLTEKIRFFSTPKAH
ncbi:MAG: hypothetical protein ACI93E_000848, partial [Flavobacteriales bacterium]